jgi:peptide-methionine (S)-S-oxide reductase
MRCTSVKFFVAALSGALLASSASLVGAEASTRVAPPNIDNPKEEGAVQTAVLAAGCFWGVQGVFEHVRGVKKVVSGYAGGDRNSAQYETVSTGTTGHAESVQIIFDPAQISYGQLLEIAFSVVHDPTELNRQGPDTGSQYRSAIFYTDAAQQRIAVSYIAQLDQAHAFAKKIATSVVPLKGFYPAEGYHQDYLVRHPYAPYIAYNDLPKVEGLRQQFPELYNPDPVLTGEK